MKERLELYAAIFLRAEHYTQHFTVRLSLHLYAPYDVILKHQHNRYVTHNDPCLHNSFGRITNDSPSTGNADITIIICNIFIIFYILYFIMQNFLISKIIPVQDSIVAEPRINGEIISFLADYAHAKTASRERIW